MVQRISRRSLIAEALVSSKDKIYGILGGQSDTGADFSPSTIPPFRHTVVHSFIYHRISYTYSVKHNTGVFCFKLCLYTCATCFGLYLGKPQACQYKNLRRQTLLQHHLKLYPGLQFANRIKR